MSVGAAGAARPGRRLAHRLLIAVLALAAVGGALALLAWVFAGDAPPPRPARNPFGVGAPPPAPATGGLAGWIVAVQTDFYRQLTASVRAMKESGAAATTLMTLSFLYGVFHAAGPGHGKAVIAGYIVASERALRRGIGLSFAAALVQALVAIGIVGIFAIGLNATAARMQQAEQWVETASFAAVAAIGAVLLWRKAGRLAGLIDAPGAPTRSSLEGGGGRRSRSEGAEPPLFPDSPEGLPPPSALRPTPPPSGEDRRSDSSGHFHLPPAEVMERAGTLRELAAVAFAAGIRPCSGAIIVLVFALAQGLFGAGVAAVLAMGLGTALTTSALAVFAVAAKRAALAIASGRGRGALLAGVTLETLAAAFVLILGVGLLTRYGATLGGS